MEEEEEPSENLTLIEEEKFLAEHPDERIFKDLLMQAKSYQSYPEPPQQAFELSNQVRPRVRPLIKLLMHEYQEYLHHSSADVDLETIFYSISHL